MKFLQLDDNDDGQLRRETWCGAMSPWGLSAERLRESADQCHPFTPFPARSYESMKVGVFVNLLRHSTSDLEARTDETLSCSRVLFASSSVSQLDGTEKGRLKKSIDWTILSLVVTFRRKWNMPQSHVAQPLANFIGKL
jgi:hypothetical protein